MDLLRFNPTCTVSVLTDQFNDVHFDVPIQNMLYRSRIRGLFCYFKDLSGVHKVDLHLTGDLSEVPYDRSNNEYFEVMFTISGIGPVRGFFSSDIGSFDSFCSLFHDWFSCFPDTTASGYTIKMSVKKKSEV